MDIVSFLVCSIWIVIILYIPGFAALSLFGSRLSLSVSVAPLASTGILCMFGIVASLLQVTISAPLLLMYIGLFAVFGIGFLVSRVCAMTTHYLSSKVRNLLISIIICSVIGAVLYIVPLNGLDSVAMTYDNVAHFGTVQSFAQSGEWSVFEFSRYLSSESAKISPFMDSGGYYPGAWHIISAATIMLSGASVAVATNAVNYIIVAVIYPLSVFGMMSSITSPSARVAYIAPVASLFVASMPWALANLWPLYPNLLSMALLPAAIALFIAASSKNVAFYDRVRYFLMFFAALLTFVFVQPNSCFSIGVYLVPYCIYIILRSDFKRAKRDGHIKLLKAALILAFCALAACTWLVFYQSSFMTGVVNFFWPPLYGIKEGILSIITLRLISASPQPILILLVLVGLFSTLRNNDVRWTAVSILIMSSLYIVSVSFGDCPAKHLLTGFWYTDPYRVAAMLGFSLVVPVSFGIEHVFPSLYMGDSLQSRSMILLLDGTAILVLCLALQAYPGKALRLMADNRYLLNQQHNQSMYSSDEQEFILKAMQVIPQGEFAINQPYDGSLFAYGLNNAPLFYRDMSGYGSLGESQFSKSVRLRINEIDQLDNLKDSLKQRKINYILLLHRDEEESIRMFPDYKPEDWIGINSITDETSGIEVLLTQDDMRLYRIL